MIRALYNLPAVIILSLILGTCLPDDTHALTVNESCAKVETIFARGSGQKVSDSEADAARYFNQIIFRINDESIPHNDYELGTEMYGGYQYPAIKVDNWSFLNGLGASLSAGYHFSYGDSVKKGVGELQSYIKQRYSKCEKSNTRYILGGTSQGAQVIGQALAGIERGIRDDIVFVGLFGDPKLHYPEGEGWNPPACRGKDLSLWRRAASNCDLDNGSLTSRRPYLPEDMKVKTGLWCYARDEVCDPGQIPAAQIFGSAHGDYKNKDQGIDQAAREAIEKLKDRLKKDNPPPKPTPEQPNPQPPIDYDRVLNVQRFSNEGTTGENTVFAVDVSDYMQHEIPAIEQFLRGKISSITAKGGQVSIVAYIGVKDGNGEVIDNTGVITPFGLDPQVLLDNLNTILHPNGSHLPGSSLITFHTIFEVLNWKIGATKSVTLFTNSPLQNPDIVGLTVDEIAKKALEIDPVNIYPVVPQESKDSYTELAEKTSGQVLTYTDNIIEAANKAYEKITARPIPLLKNTEYKAEPGQEITFDASDSYVLNAKITKYEWDYNGDGQFEKTTSTPSTNHIYPVAFEGHMQVRISADNGTIANMSAKVTVKTIAPPNLPPAPKNLAYSITKTENNKSTVTINWQSNSEVPAWLISINDMPMGHVEGDRTSLEITDVDRGSEVIIGVASAIAINNQIVPGGSGTITIPKITTEPEQPPVPPILSQCKQSNFFIRVLCQVIAILKTYINGALYYILPYRI